jgi:sulfatase modifying factor 1
MREPLFLFAAMVAISASAQKEADNFVFVKGGIFKNAKSTNYYGKPVSVSDFSIGKYEVTQKEWM